MKICIVGSGGFIGTSLKNYFLSKNTEVVQFTSKKKLLSQKKDFLFDYYDLSEPQRLISILSDVDTLFYLCSPDHQTIEMNPKMGVDIVLGPLANILNAKKHLKNMKIIYFSTAQVFNSVGPEKTISNKTGISPNNYYGLFHAFGEKMLLHCRESIKQNSLTSIRLTNSFGFLCDASCNWRLPALNDFISSAFGKNEIIMRSDGSPFRDFVEISRVMQTCYNLASFRNLPENIICGSELTVNLSYVINLIQKIFKNNYSREIKIKSDFDLKLPEVKAVPRYIINKDFNKKCSISEFDKDIEKAIIDYERFSKCL